MESGFLNIQLHNKIIKKIGTLPILVLILILIIGGLNLIQTEKPVIKGEEIDRISDPFQIYEYIIIDFNNEGSRYAYTSAIISRNDTDIFFVASIPSSNNLPKTIRINHSDIFSSIDVNDTTRYPVSWIEWSPNGNYIVAAEQKSKIAIWDVSQNIPTLVQALVDIESDKMSFYDISWSPDSTKVSMLLFNSTVLIWDVSAGLIVEKFYFQSETTRKIEWSPDGNYIAVINGSVASQSYTLTTINLETKQFYIYEHQISSLASSIDWSKTNQIMIATYGEIVIWDSETKRMVHKLDLNENIKSASFLDVNKIVVTIGHFSPFKSIIFAIVDNEGLTEFKGKVIYLNTKESILYSVQSDLKAPVGQTNTIITKLDYSNIESEYKIYKYRISSGYILLPFTIVSLGISLLGLYRKFTNYIYLK